MQQWEYKVEEIRQIFSFRVMEGKLNRIGHEGWELVGVYSEGDNHYAMFKRPKIPATDPTSVGIADLDLSVRAFNCLNYADILTVGELIDYRTENLIIVSDEKLMKIRNMGKKTYEEIIRKISEKLEEIGFELKVASDMDESTIVELRKRMTVKELDFSVKTFNFLKRRGINTVVDLLNYSEEDLRKSAIDTVWEKRWERVSDEIKQKLAMMGLSWHVE